MRVHAFAYSERGVRRAPDLLPEDYMGTEKDSCIV